MKEILLNELTRPKLSLWCHVPLIVPVIIGHCFGEKLICPGWLRNSKQKI